MVAVAPFLEESLTDAIDDEKGRRTGPLVLGSVRRRRRR